MTVYIYRLFPTICLMSEISRRLFLTLLGALIPGVFGEGSNAATTKKPSPTPTPKKSTPTPTSKKASPTPTSKKKKSPSPTPSKTSKASPSAQPSQSKTLEGVVIAKSTDLALRQTKIFFLKDSFGISTGYSLTRTSRGVVAFDISCTHAGVPTSVRDFKLECPAHGSIFDPENGLPVRGPAVSPLKSYRTVEGNGEIRIITS